MKLRTLVCLAAAVVIGVAVSSDVSASGGYFFVTSWGSQGSGDGQFDYATGVAVDSSDNVYVADYHNNRVQKFDSNGTFLAKWGSLGSGDGEFDGPDGVAVDSSDNVYVADHHNNRVQKFDSSGAFLIKWGSAGSGDGQFNGVHGLAVDSSDNVYVVDPFNRRIQKFDSNGTFLTKWGSLGDGDGQFYNPQYVAVDGTGHVYVTDSHAEEPGSIHNRVEKFDSTGTFLTMWGSAGSGDGQFNFPIGVAVDSSGDVYVTDGLNTRVEKFDPTGIFLAEWDIAGYPVSLAFDGSGDLYITDGANNEVLKFAPDSIPPTTSIVLSPSSPNGLNGWYVSAVHATVSALDNAGGSGVAATRCKLDPLSPPSTFDDLLPGCSYTGAGSNVSGDGQHSMYAASVDNVGNKEAVASVGFKIDQLAPTVTCGAAPTFTLGSAGGTVGATVTDGTSGPAASPISAAVTSSDTATAGVKNKPLTGYDNAGNQTTVNCSYIVGYQVLGFFSRFPKQNVNGGSSIAVKFALADSNGARIPDSEAQALATACMAQIFFPALQPSPNCFSYDPVGNQFVFNLKTPKGETGLQTITANVFSGATAINVLSTQVNLK